MLPALNIVHIFRQFERNEQRDKLKAISYKLSDYVILKMELRFICLLPNDALN